jgi:hypothetical protein
MTVILRKINLHSTRIPLGLTKFIYVLEYFDLEKRPNLEL